MRYVAAQSVLFTVLIAGAITGWGPGLVPRSTGLVLVGVVLAVVALVLGLAGFVALGAAFQMAPQPRSDASLVSRGIYRRFRHPMYTAVTSLAMALVCFRPTVWVVTAAIAVVGFLIFKARHEETLLLDRYPTYADYRRDTWGVLPLGSRTLPGLVMLLVAAWGFLPLCDLLFDCGCTWPGFGSYTHCDIHESGPPDCPWCDRAWIGYLAFGLGAGLGWATVWALPRSAPWPLLAVAGLATYLIGVLAAGLVTALWSGRPFLAGL